MPKYQIVSIMESVSLQKTYLLPDHHWLEDQHFLQAFINHGQRQGRRLTLVATPIPGRGYWTSLALNVPRRSRPILYSKYFYSPSILPSLNQE